MQTAMRSGLRWSKEYPAKPGWYVFRRGPGSATVPARIFDQDGHMQVQFWADIGWFRLAGVKGEFAFVCK